MVMMRTWIEPVVAGAQVASSFYDTGLLLVVKHHYNQTTMNSSNEDALQKDISNFYIIHNLILGLVPLLTAYILARIGDKQNRKITICVPLAGYLISRAFLLFVILCDWPIEVMFGSAAINGLTGWFTAYWAGVMAWASQCSSESKRSLRLIVIELVYGLAGFVGSLASGHIFVHFDITKRQGAVLVSCSLVLYTFCLLYSIFVLKPPQLEGVQNSHPQDTLKVSSSSNNRLDSAEPSENSRLLGVKSDASSTAKSSEVFPCKVFICLLFAGAIFYNIAVNGAVDVLPLFLLKKPLSWDPVNIGYGNAAGYLVFITSFLGVYFFSKCLKDLIMTIIGIVSFCMGIIIMAFVRWTFLYYVARAVMMFSLIPLPTIRSVLSKHVQGSSYGKVFVVLQLSLTISAVITSIAFNKIYQAMLDTFSGFCFILSGVIAVLSLIPIGIAAYRYPERPCCTRTE
ncbi:thymic stromal cotransporter homolog [Spea bombifrons]|uniref:thymic stromal cotransporter homolog n=1 Tax=Spea bombifrons TaxID=233779 RepID=UPI00234B7726|nr:thymic stromal cotransporter homolog [Spea bombifrons]